MHEWWNAEHILDEVDLEGMYDQQPAYISNGSDDMLRVGNVHISFFCRSKIYQK